MMNKLRLLVGVPLLFACGDSIETVDEGEAAGKTSVKFCGQVYDCECDTQYENEDECIDDRTAAWDEAQRAAQQAGLDYDGKCVGRLLADYDDLACAPFLEGQCDDFCQVYYGDKGEGDECTSYGARISDCAKGLRCGGVCFDPSCPDPAGLNQSCREGPDNAGLCDDGLVCDYEGSGNCVRAPGAGQACISQQCDRDEAVCVEGKCEGLLSNGEACAEASHMCKSSYCAEGVCADPPGEGEACTTTCAEGNSCQEGVCVALPALVCGLDPVGGG